MDTKSVIITILTVLVIILLIVLYPNITNTKNFNNSTDYFSKNLECQKNKEDLIDLPEKDYRGDEVNLDQVFYSPVTDSCLFITESVKKVYYDSDNHTKPEYLNVKRYSLSDAFNNRSGLRKVACIEGDSLDLPEYYRNLIGENPCNLFWERIDYYKTGKGKYPEKNDH